MTRNSILQTLRWRQDFRRLSSLDASEKSPSFTITGDGSQRGALTQPRPCSRQLPALDQHEWNRVECPPQWWDARRMNDAVNELEDGGESENNADDEIRLMRRYHLGAIAEESAGLESLLRGVFASLLGSPRATVVAAGQSVTWLADNALAIIDTNDEVRGPSLGDPEKVARFRAAIKQCGDLYKRSQLIHGAWFDGDAALTQLRSKWRQPLAFAVEVQVEEIEGLAEELNKASGELMAAIFEVKGILAE